VLEGSVRRAGDQVRINAQLIDATTGGHIWAERYDGSMADVFGLQDKVTGQIVAALAVSLTADEQAIRTETETETAPAYDAFLQGWELYRLGTAEDWAAAIPFLEKAIKLDPDYGRAYAALAAIYWNSARNSWTRSLGLTWNEALEKTRLNLRQAMNNPSTLAHQVASERAAYLQRTAGKAIDQADLAIALDTNDPAGYLAMANALIKADKPDEAVDLVRRAMRLDPHFPASYLTRLGRAQFAMGDYEGAAATFDRAAGRNPENDWTFVYLAAAYGHLGNQQDAKIAVEAANALRAQRGWSTLTLENVDKERAFGERVAVLPERKSLREGLGQAGVAAGTEWMALVKTAPTGFEVEGAATIDAEAAKALHARDVNFVDLRRRAWWSRGRIPGAHNLYALDDFDEARLLEIVSKDEEVVIYGVGEERQMATAAAKAVAWGFQKVYYLDDGFDGWKNAGYPVEKNN
jgi:tetratricopeptide (TPR) repeat protein